MARAKVLVSSQSQSEAPESCRTSCENLFQIYGTAIMAMERHANYAVFARLPTKTMQCVTYIKL